MVCIYPLHNRRTRAFRLIRRGYICAYPYLLYSKYPLRTHLLDPPFPPHSIAAAMEHRVQSSRQGEKPGVPEMEPAASQCKAPNTGLNTPSLLVRHIYLAGSRSP